jgi:glycerophosphoryl diester phosphodiesterase
VATLRLAHRGDGRPAPENTLAAFHAALAVPGCDGLEFDVRMSADGVPVVIHDATLLRVQGRRGRVRELSAQALGDMAVPTLATVLASVPRSVFLDVELKDDPGLAFDEVLEGSRGPGLDRAVVSSFDTRILARIGGSRSAWPRWLNVRDLRPATLEIASELGCAGVACAWRAINRRGLDRVAAAGLVLAVWTVSDVVTYRRLEHEGVVAICAEGDALDMADTPGTRAAAASSSRSRS